MTRLCIVLSILLLDAPSHAGDDRSALGGIFAEQHVADSAVALHRRSMALPVEKRFLWLRNWVLPGASHAEFRLNGAFLPDSQSLQDGVDGATNGSLDSQSQSLRTGAVHSAAIDLIEAAKMTGRLKELRERIVECSAKTDLQKYRQATLLFLAAVSIGEDSAVIEAFDRVIRHAEPLDGRSWELRWPAFLMLRSVMSNSKLRSVVSEYFYSRFDDLMQYRPDPDLDVLNDHLRAISGLLPHLDAQDVKPSEPVTSQWDSFSYSDSGTHGLGRPQANWRLESGAAIKLTGHETDFLCFQSPLRGDFEIECDVSGSAGKHVSVMQAGTHLELADDGTSMRIGNFRKSTRVVKFDPRLTKPEEWTRYRAVSRKGVLTQFLNGAAVQTRDMPKQHSPWFAIRSWRRSLGQVRDVRITGSPTIPDRVLMTVSQELDDWAPYFEDGFASSGNWSGVTDSKGVTEIRGRARPELSGMFVEKLLRYFRPLFENGTLDFEFFYRTGASAVAPALGRTAYLIEPDGVWLHEITDRQYDQLELDPANRREEPNARRGPEKLPLIENDWNHLKLKLEGSRLALTLNGTPIFEHSLATSNGREFGLFHFADQSEVRVRNVGWSGDWPKELPTLQQQMLANHELDELEERIAKLPAVLRHDFRNGLPDELFNVEIESGAFQQTKHGTQVERINMGGLGQLIADVQLHGDFDIVSRFSNLEVEMPQPRWQAGIGLRVLFDSPLSHRCSAFRLVARNADNRRVSFYQSSDNPDVTRRISGHYVVEESRSGRLRVCRYGKKLFGLYAADDSPHFRLIRVVDTVSDPTTLNGVCLAIEGAATTSVRAEWNELVIRAERIKRGTPEASVPGSGKD